MGRVRSSGCYFFLRADACVNALPAADLESLEVRPSRSVFEAAVAATGDVVFAGALRWESALPAALFEALAVAGFESVFEALRAAGFDVTSFLAMEFSPFCETSMRADRKKLQLRLGTGTGTLVIM